MSDSDAGEDQANAKHTERIFLITIAVLVAVEVGIIFWVVYSYIDPVPPLCGAP